MTQRGPTTQSTLTAIDFKKFEDHILKAISSSVEIAILKNTEKIAEKIAKIEYQINSQGQDIDYEKKKVQIIFEKLDKLSEYIPGKVNELEKSSKVVSKDIEDLSQQIKHLSEDVEKRATVEKFIFKIFGGLGAVITLIFLGVQAFK